ncbi:MAG TPA: DUF2087 domain-containing protein [Mycobacteriales bacterium]|nr:DUF2087 domain-containing protein [Mycobacteriales bacterium]
MDLTGLLAEPERALAFAAVALGATTTAEVSIRADISPKAAALAVRRLTDAGVLVVAGHRGLQVDYAAIKEQAKARSAIERARTDDDDVETSLRPFVRDGKLLRLPSQQQKKVLALEHIVTTSFRAGATYDEQSVNETLKAWCEGGAADHVTVRRYLVDFGFLDRAEGIYRVRAGEPALT